MADIFYKIADGRIWDVQKAQWIDSDVAQIIMAAQNNAIATASLDSDENIEASEQIDNQGVIINLESADGESDIYYLARTLAFYDYPLGELVWHSAKGIKEELARLDEKYLTPRVLAGLATGDSYAMTQWYEHEQKAIPLRQRLEVLKSE